MELSLRIVFSARILAASLFSISAPCSSIWRFADRFFAFASRVWRFADRFFAFASSCFFVSLPTEGLLFLPDEVITNSPPRGPLNIARPFASLRPVFSAFAIIVVIDFFT
ncbi:hypothetical protein MT325_m474L [Paramecium bursaria chlorella virus MT325]|uniref:Uncharacterized protein m474L n=1 Tax=Paramecium bursaria Chlorella virus MT325 TaxID=346932 RepID=A7IUK4_PBCVM|nr:hypothetical protein MT325_m474L [Paramecium bursaria chlorella virus MT325]